jgi:hypothetical protein
LPSLLWRTLRCSGITRESLCLTEPSLLSRATRPARDPYPTNKMYWGVRPESSSLKQGPLPAVEMNYKARKAGRELERVDDQRNPLAQAQSLEWFTIIPALRWDQPW